MPLTAEDRDFFIRALAYQSALQRIGLTGRQTEHVAELYASHFAHFAARPQARDLEPQEELKHG